MEQPYIQMPGATITPAELTIARAQTVANAVEANPYTQLVECYKLTDDVEFIIFEAQIELGQRRVNDIQGLERIAVRFERADIAPPEVLALRADFPKVPHLNLRE